MKRMFEKTLALLLLVCISVLTLSSCFGTVKIKGKTFELDEIVARWATDATEEQKAAARKGIDEFKSDEEIMELLVFARKLESKYVEAIKFEDEGKAKVKLSTPLLDTLTDTYTVDFSDKDDEVVLKGTIAGKSEEITVKKKSDCIKIVERTKYYDSCIVFEFIYKVKS